MRTNITIFSASRSVHLKGSKIFFGFGRVRWAIQVQAQGYAWLRSIHSTLRLHSPHPAYFYNERSDFNGREKESHSEWSRSVTHLILTSVELFESRLTLTQDQTLTEFKYFSWIEMFLTANVFFFILWIYSNSTQMDKQHKQNITKVLQNSNQHSWPCFEQPDPGFNFTISSRLSISWTSKQDFPLFFAIIFSRVTTFIKTSDSLFYCYFIPLH